MFEFNHIKRATVYSSQRHLFPATKPPFEAPPGNSDFFDKKDPRPVLEIHLDINRTVALVRRGEGRLFLRKNPRDVKSWEMC